MKKLLPKTSGNPKGFTLIELLVVISILAILATIAATIFSGVQSRARNGRRQADILALAKSLEAFKPATGNYQPMATTNFAGGVIPNLDPQGFPYCIDYSTGTAVADAATTGWTNSPVACPLNYEQVSATLPPSTTTIWKVCSLLEITPVVVFCNPSSQ